MTEQQGLGLIVIYVNRQQFAGVKSADPSLGHKCKAKEQ